MTGLDITKDHLIEIAVLITDGDLNVVAEVQIKCEGFLSSRSGC